MENTIAVAGTTGDIVEVITADQIIKAHKEVVDVTWKLMETGNSFVHKAAAVGRLLIAKREELGHGNYLPWLAENIKEFGWRTSYDYIKAAKYLQRAANLESDKPMTLRSILDLRQAVGMLEDKPEKSNGEREKPLFVIRCAFNVEPARLDEHQRRDAFEQAMPLLQALQSYGFIEIKETA